MSDHRMEMPAKGQACLGTVTRIEPSGVFVELDGGAEGFIRVPELAWRPVRRIGDVVGVGDRVRAQVLDVDLRRRQVYLSLKATEEDPFPRLAQLVGQVILGQVTKVVPIGVFVRIEDRPDGFEGLLRSVDLGRQFTEADHGPQAGELVRVIVRGVDVSRRRILLAAAGAHLDGR